MKELFTPDMPQAEREMILAQHAFKIENTDYYLPLTPEELTDKKDIFFTNASEINKLEEKLKLVTSDLREQLKGIKGINGSLLSEIRTGQKLVTGKLYQVANYDTSMMETFTASGEMLSSRRLRPEEKQGNVFSIQGQKAM